MTRSLRLLSLAGVFALAACPTPTPAPTLPEVALGDTTVGISVSKDLHATGGKAPLTYAATGVPAGMTFDSGVLSGAPTAAGDFTVSVTVTDAANQQATKGYAFKVYAAPAFQAAGIPDAIVGATYSVQFAMTGGKAPFTYVATATDLPPELSFAATTGTLSGTPSATASFGITVKATDANGASVSTAFSAQILEQLRIITTSLPQATVGTAYSTFVQALGGKSPVAFSLSGGVLPPGLSLDAATGKLSGTPAAGGDFTFTIKVTDASNHTATANFTVKVFSGTPVQITTSSVAFGVVGAAYAQALAASGGQTPYTWSASAGSLPAGIALSSSGTLAGTPTAAGTSSIAVTVTDANSQTASATLVLTIYGTLAAGTGTLPDGYAGDGYAFSFAASGGRTPYAWSLLSGSLPAGLTLSSAGALTGTPAQAGTFAFTVQVTDDTSQSASRSVSVSILAPLSVGNAALADGSVGVAYSETLFAVGGKAPYTYAVAGALPAGITANGASLSGTPTATGGPTTFTATVTDGNGKTASKNLSIRIWAGMAITTGSLPDGYLTVAYSQTLAAVGGTAPYSWSINGTLPPGIALSGDKLVGTPTASGTYSFNVVVTDSASGTNSKSLAIVVAPALTITKAALADGYRTSGYADSLTGSGGKAPYTWASSGTLPPGVTLGTNGVFSGTPTAAGTFSLTAQLTDQNGTTATKALQIVIYDPPFLADATFRTGTQGATYSQTIPGSGGKAPLSYSVTSGQLPAGLSIAAANISGTPTAAETQTFTVQVVDQNGRTASKAYSITVNAPAQVSTASLPDGYPTVPYSQALAATGGLAPYSWSITTGSLPNGLSLGGSSIAGTPTASGNSSFTVQVTDANGATATRALTLTIAPALSVTTASVPDTYVGDGYSAALAASGGLAPYTWSISGSLPPGISLSNGSLTGAATAAGTSSFIVRATDANSTSATKSLSITVSSLPSIATASLPNAFKDVAYSATLAASGGRTPYSWSVTSGALPTGLILNAASGQISGTPTGGTTTFSITVSDAGGKTATQAFTLTVINDPSITTAGPLPVAYGTESYSQTFTASGGATPYTWSVSAGAPAGLTMNASTGALGGTVSGTIGNAQAFTFTVTVTDANSRSATASYTITTYLLPQLTTTSVDTATEGITYRHAPGVAVQVSASQGLAPYTFSAAGLPAGLAMNGSGIVSGIPGQGTAGSYVVNVTITDANGHSAIRTLPLTVVAAAPINNGGWYSVEPQGSPITDVVTIFAIDAAGRPLSGLGVRLRKNGAEYGTVKEALTNASGKAFFTGLGLNGTTDTLDVTANGAGYENFSVMQLNAALITLKMPEFAIPLPRLASPMLYDAARQKLLLFGGSDMDPYWGAPTNSTYGCITDVDRLDAVNTATWTQVVPSGMASSPPQRFGRQAAYVAGGTEVFFGGADCATWAPQAETWKFSSAASTWTQIFPAQSPPARTAGAMVTDPSGYVLLFSGDNGASDLWSFDPVNNAWTPITVAIPPPARSNMGYAMRTATSDFWICGGTDSSGTDQSDCWSYNRAANAWTARPSLPQGRTELAMAYDSATNTLYAFAGASGGVARNDLLRLGPADGAWVTLTANGDPSAPPTRRSPQMAYLPASTSLVVFGGLDGTPANYYGNALGDTWTFTPSTGVWAKRNATPLPATVTLSGTISGGYPTGTMTTYVMAGTPTGWSSTKLVRIVSGSGQYRIPGIPYGSTVSLHAYTRAPTAAGMPGNIYSFVDAGSFGPLYADTTRNIVFPGATTATTATATVLQPSNWSTAVSLTGMPYMIRSPGFAKLRIGMGSGLGGTPQVVQLSYFDIPGASKSASLYGIDNEPSGCEYSYRTPVGFSTGNMGSFQLPLAQRGMTPGQNPCTPEGTAFLSTWANTTGTTPVAIAVGKFLGNDNALDAAVANSGSNTVALYHGDGVITDVYGSNYWLSAGTVATGTNPVAIAIVDLIGDSNPDLVVLTRGDSTLRIYAGNGNGFAAAAPADTYTVNLTQPIRLGVADVNNDTRPDLVILNGGGTVVTYLNEGGWFLSSGAVALGGIPTAMALGDVSGDGVPDLAVTLTDPANVPEVVIRRADIASGAFNISGPVLYPDANPAAIALGDYSGDGKLDIVVGHSPGTRVASFQNLGTGSFAAPEFYSVGDAVPTIGLRDFNGDGRADLVLTRVVNEGMSLYLRNPAGGWGYATGAWSGPATKDLVISDLNGDGQPDVLIANSGNDSFSTFLGERPLPAAADPQFTLTAPANAKLAYVYRGAYLETYEWMMTTPAAEGPMTFRFPLPSTLAASRPTPSGQRAHWDPNFDLYDVATPFNYQDTRFRGDVWGYTGTQSYGYVRQ